ncbi:hypothetical protein GCM10009793_03440 [Brachybacterium phenoliresistens]
MCSAEGSARECGRAGLDEACFAEAKRVVVEESRFRWGLSRMARAPARESALPWFSPIDPKTQKIPLSETMWPAYSPEVVATSTSSAA